MTAKARHVVVIEDDPINASLFRRILERRGALRVTVTESAEELVQLVSAGEVDLVLMDISLRATTWQGKSVNGVDLCRVLRGDARTAGVPIILATAHAMRGDAERLLQESGANDYVSKPVMDHEEFMTRVKRWTEAEAA